MIDYRLIYHTRHKQKHVKKPWKDPPDGLERAYMRTPYKNDKGSTICEVVATCRNKDGSMRKEVFKPDIHSTNPRSISLRLIRE